MSRDGDFSSKNVTSHLARGAVGFGSIVCAFALMPAVGPLSLLLLPLGVVALRGCPMCWVMGLAQTISNGRVKRVCVDGVCHVERVADDGSRVPATRA